VGKLLIFIIIGVMVYFLFFKKSLSNKENEKPKKLDESDMVECNKCGVYVNVKEAIIKDGKYYCSQECAGVKA